MSFRPGTYTNVSGAVFAAPFLRSETPRRIYFPKITVLEKCDAAAM